MKSKKFQTGSFLWPENDISNMSDWHEEGNFYIKGMPEEEAQLAKDSRWPCFFPSPIAFVTTGCSSECALEKVVGATIVNRFPYIMAISFCRKEISQRHHLRAKFMETLEKNGTAALQFLSPGKSLDKVMNAILTLPEEDTFSRIKYTELNNHISKNSGTTVFDDAYMIYEGKLVKPGKDFDGNQIHPEPWLDIGSHRVYLIEVNSIQLRKDIAQGESRILWKSLPGWGTPSDKLDQPVPEKKSAPEHTGYTKGFTANYLFPSSGTTDFEADDMEGDMKVKHLPPNPESQVEIDNDRARWPCFFPSFVSMITSWGPQHEPGLMPCGSTTVVSRHPFVIAVCISYAKINERYAPRKTLENINREGKFGCAISFNNDEFIDTIKYSGNISLAEDSCKFVNSGLSWQKAESGPYIPAVPIHYECEVIKKVRLGTHLMVLGEVKKIMIKENLTPDNPMTWTPWAEIIKSQQV